MCSNKSDKIYGLGNVQKCYGELLQVEPRYDRRPTDAIVQVLRHPQTSFGPSFLLTSSTVEDLDIDITQLPGYSYNTACGDHAPWRTRTAQRHLFKPSTKSKPRYATS